jgi:hypothetical protein
MEMNSVVIGERLVETIMAETEVFRCPALYKQITASIEKFELINSTEPELTIDKRNHFETAECVKSIFSATVLACSFRAIG